MIAPPFVFIELYHKSLKYRNALPKIKKMCGYFTKEKPFCKFYIVFGKPSASFPLSVLPFCCMIVSLKWYLMKCKKSTFLSM
jgi:hypothetical protein